MEPKEVFVTNEKMSSSVEAEFKLRIGKLNPDGSIATPTYRIEGDATGIPFERIGRVKAGHGTELVTRERIPVKK